MGESLFDGIGYIRRQGLIFTLLVTSALFSIFGRSYIILLPVFAKAVLNIGASGLGFISAAPGLGTIVGSLGVAALGRSQVNRRTMVMSLCGTALALFLFAASGSLTTACLMLIVVGMLSMTFDTLLNTLIQLNVTDSYRGRVMGVYGLTAAGMREFGGMQAGFLAEWTGAPFAIEAGAVAVGVVALAYLGPRLKKLASS
jgi:MFS family permease